MKIVGFESNEGLRLGVVEGDQVIDLQAVDAKVGRIEGNRVVDAARDGPSDVRPAKDATVVVHKLYNPEGINTYNVVPGLIGVILTLTTTLMTALALTRETERGTMENLLAMPVRPIDTWMWRSRVVSSSGGNL